jgi:hypothetical protein
VASPERIADLERRPSLLRPLLWVLAIASVAYLPLFAGKIIFFRDIAHWGFPARAFLRDSLLRGELPAWNPYQGLGFPVFADPLYGPFYPPNWLYLLVGPGHVASMFNWQCFLHMIWGAAGICWLARRLGLSRPATVVAGLAWALSGYTTAQWSSGLLLLADAWIPWAAVGQVALLDALRAGGSAWRRGLVKAALPTVFAVLLGEVFLAMIGAGFGVVFALCLHAAERHADPALPRVRPAWLGYASAAVLAAFACGAVVILPARTLLGSTERSAALPREMAERCSLHPLRLAELVAPQSMGDAYGEYPAAPVIGEAKLDGLPLSYSVYLGASVVALALAAFGRGRRVGAALGLLLVAALGLALGRYTPVFGIVRRIVFPLAYMRYPEKLMALVVATAALLAGTGTERVLSPGPQPWRRTLALLALIAALGLAAYLALPTLWMVFAVRGALMGAVAVLAVLAVQLLAARGSRAAVPLLLAIVAFDLARAAWPLQGFGTPMVADRPPPAARLALQRHADPVAPPRIYRSHQVTEAVNRWVQAQTNAEGELRLVATLITNTVNAWGVGTLPGYDAAIPALVERVWHEGLAVGVSALRLLGADYAVLPVADPRAPDRDRPGLEPVFDPLPGARMYRVPHALPRAFLAGRAQVLSDDAALARIFDAEVVSGGTAWLAPGGEAAARAGASARAGDCRLETYANHRLVAVCAAQAPALAVFTEQYDRGWRATVDGVAAPLLRANLIMRAVALPVGSHRIVLEYRTPGLVAGGVVSLGFLLLLGGVWWWGRRRSPAR